MGMPQAEAGIASEPYYFEKIDPDGNPIGGSEWEIRSEDSVSMRELEKQWGKSPVEGNYKIIDNYTPDGSHEQDDDGFTIVRDLDPRPGHFAFTNTAFVNAFNRQAAFSLREVASPEGFTSCGPERPEVHVSRKGYYNPETKEYDELWVESTDESGNPIEILQDGGRRSEVTLSNTEVRDVTDKRLRPGAYSTIGGTQYAYMIDWEGKDTDKSSFIYLPETRTPAAESMTVTDDRGQKIQSTRNSLPVHVIGAIVNCPVTTTTSVTTAPATTVVTTNPASTVTQPPTTVTAPGGKVTKPGTTNTTVVTNPAVTVTPAPTTKAGDVETVTLPGTTVSLPDVTSTRPNVTVTGAPDSVTATVAKSRVTTVVTSTITEPTAVPAAVERSSSTTQEMKKPVSTENGNEEIPEPKSSEAPGYTNEDASETTEAEEPQVTPSAEQTPAPTVENRSLRVLAATGVNGSLTGLFALAGVALVGCAVFIRRVARQ